MPESRIGTSAGLLERAALPSRPGRSQAERAEGRSRAKFIGRKRSAQRGAAERSSSDYAWLRGAPSAAETRDALIFARPSSITTRNRNSASP